MLAGLACGFERGAWANRNLAALHRGNRQLFAVMIGLVGAHPLGWLGRIADIAYPGSA
jgi:hypothetical protein